MRESMNNWKDERMKEWMNEWMNKWKYILSVTWHYGICFPNYWVENIIASVLPSILSSYHRQTTYLIINSSI